MKIKNLAVLAMVSVVSFFACADSGDILITFSTPGTDTYADGTPVKDGEWYAVCWSADGTFHGLTTDCQAISNATEELILAAPLAKDGRCPLTAFEFARKTAYEKGKFSIFLLDTRNASGDVAVRGANGLPVFVQGQAVAMTSATKGSAMEVTTASTTASGSATWGQTALQGGNVTGAKIKAFEIVGANIQLTVENLGAGTVVVKTGESVDKMNTFAVPSVSATDKATFIIPKDKGKFFSVVTVQ